MTNETRTESLAFLKYALERVVLAAGGSADHARYVADAISFAHIQGKLSQGLGVYEVAPEDFALCEYGCTSKIEAQKVVRKALDLVKQECG